MKTRLIPIMAVLTVSGIAILFACLLGTKPSAVEQQGEIVDAADDQRDSIKQRDFDLADVAQISGQVLGKVGGLVHDRAKEVVGDPSKAPTNVDDVLGWLRSKPENDAADEKSESAGSESGTTSDDDSESIDLLSRTIKSIRSAAAKTDELGQSALALNPCEEKRLGQQITRELARHFRFDSRPGQINRLQNLAQPILERRSRREIEYQFEIIDDEKINAFAILGGSIYVHRGLLDLNPSDVELQGILGHEIGHVDLEHCVRGFTYAIRASEIGGKIAGDLTHVAYQTLRVVYSEAQELEADEFAFRAMVKTGHSHEDSSAFARFLLKMDAVHERGNEGGQSHAVLDALSKEINKHYRTHPPSMERIRRLERLSKKMRQASK